MVENRLVEKRMVDSLKKHFRSGYIQPLGDGKTIFFIIHIEIQYIFSHRGIKNPIFVQISPVFLQNRIQWVSKYVSVCYPRDLNVFLKI